MTVSIRHKLVAIILGGGLVPLLAGFALLAAADLRALKKDLYADSALLAQVVGDNSVAALAFQDREASQKTLARLSRVPDVEQAALYDREGRLFASYGRRDHLPPLPERIAPPPEASAREVNGHLEVYQPAIYEGERFGTLHLRASTAELRSRVRAYLGGLAGLALGVAAVSLGLAVVLQRSVSRPILALAEVARKVSRDRAVRIRKTSDDEIGFLCDAFNGMLDALEKRERERDLADAALRRSEEAQRFLADTTARLAESLDPLTTLEGVARIAVPALADFSVVYVAGEAGTLDQGAVAHRDPTKEGLLQALRRLHPPDPLVPHPIFGAVRAAAPMIVNELPAALPPAGDGQLLGTLRTLGTTSLLAVPLVVRGEVFGVLVCARAQGARYDKADLGLAEELARRAAIAIENARLFQKAQEAIRVRDEFLSVASHELKTPLTGLKLQVQTLQRAGPTPGESRESLERIDRQITRLDRLISNLLDVSRVASGQLLLELEEVDLARVTTEVAARFAEEIAGAGSTLEIKAGAPAVGRWDRIRLEQIVTNLLSNAVKYGAGKPIQVTVEAGDQRGRLMVRDYGIGIAPENVERIFGPFERAVSVRQYGGLGLGLFITRQLAEALGGTIRVTSVLGTGSLFTVELPTAGPSAAAARSRSPTPS